VVAAQAFNFGVSFLPKFAAMKLLLVAATQHEIQPLINQRDVLGLNLDILITGVGMVATAFSLGKKLASTPYDLAINAGIAGAFHRDLQLGDVVNVTQDRLIELGAENNDSFISIDQLGFGESIFESSFDRSFLNSIPKVSGITVNTIHGNAASIAKVNNYVNPQVESMEGAAFFYGCKQMNIPCLQIRSISNYVEPRNRDSWNIPLAIKNLNRELLQLIQML
jgi:futalosine hydrolase